jgi:hypothetical protein
MAIIIECPNENYTLENNKNIKLFLAGGITGCENWQILMINKLKDVKNLTIYNPRRKEFDVNDKNIMEQQIVWEYNHLHKVDIVSFWFAKETLNPITLYELGKANASNKEIIIGIDPEYVRKDDVIIQTKLIRNDIQTFYYDLDIMCELIKIL